MKFKQLITIFGIIILLASIGLGGYFAYTNGLLNIKTDPSIQPTKIKITNRSHDRFTISWITEVPTIGSIIYGKNTKLDQLQIDDVDQLSGQQIARSVHHVTLANLDPETNYQFKIRSGEKNTIFDDSGKAFNASTGPVLSAQPAADLINGSVLLSDNKPAIDAIVYINLPGAIALSTQVKRDGTWLLNLAMARESSLTEYANYDPQIANYDIFVQGETKTSKILLTTANDSPVPNVVLGETYDFTQELAQATPMPSATPESTNSAKLASQFPLETEKESTDSAETPEINIVDEGVNILSPLEQYEEMESNRPQFSGTGPAGTVLTISITGQENLSTSTTVNTLGAWTYTPPRVLSEGSYSLEINYVDDNDENQSIERNFIIGAASGTGGTTEADEASVSARIATPRPTIAPRRAMPSTASGTPESGFELPTIMLLLLGLGLAITGFGWKKSFNLN